MSKFRKKPVVIEASQWFKHGDHPAVTVAPRGKESGVTGWCPTLEGGHIVTPGDWIITGVQGEHYPCKPDIFEMTYEPADQAPEPVAWMRNDGITTLHAIVDVLTKPVRDIWEKVNPSQVERYTIPLYLAPPSESSFKDAVLDALTICWALKAEHETDARLAVADLIAQETRIALDPAVSGDAQTLIDTGRASERERCAKACEEYATWGGSNFHDWFMKCAAAIRKMGDE